MLSKAFKRCTGENHILRLALVFALFFAAAHVALHDLDLNGGGLDLHDCQVCRLNHMPTTSLVVPSLLVPLQLLAYLLPVADTEYQLSHLSHTQWARAPPLF